MADSRNFSRKTPHLFDALYTREVTWGIALSGTAGGVLALLSPAFAFRRVCAINEVP
jgi:hypothetical protein